MKNVSTLLCQAPALKLTSVIAVFLFFAVNNFAQSLLPSLPATQIIKQVETGQIVKYENTTITGDFDLSYLSQRTNDAIYPEKGKIARVFSAKIIQPMSFKNVVFTGKLTFFRKEENAKEIKEYRIVFDKAVIFENCTFSQTADFELTNFDGGVSFANSTFRDKPSFVRIGLEKVPNLTKTIFENGSIFKNFQDDSPRNFSVAEIENFYRKYLHDNK